MSEVRLIVATWSSGLPASGKIIKEMPGSVVSGTSYIITQCNVGGGSVPLKMWYIISSFIQFCSSPVQQYLFVSNLSVM